MKKKIISVVMALVMSTSIAVPYLIAHAAKSGKTSNYTPTIESKPTKLETIDLLSGNISTFAKEYRVGLSDSLSPRVDSYAPVPVILDWEAEEEVLYYNVKISRKSDFSESEKYLTVKNSLTLNNLFMGTKYYYQVTAHYENKTVKSRIFTFETSYAPRTIYIAGVSNTRDFGGYYTADGKHRVRQGMVYRGGQLEGANSESLQDALETFGFKTDLDLRGGATTSPLGQSVNFVNVSGPYYVDAAGSDEGAYITSSSYKEALLTEIRTFANAENYPIYVHCSLGRDRTGTLAFLINALCGVEKRDLYLDYETTFFSTIGCSGQPNSALVTSVFTDLYNFIDNYQEAGTLADKTAAFMLDLGITQAEIDAIRNILIEEV